MGRCSKKKRQKTSKNKKNHANIISWGIVSVILLFPGIILIAYSEKLQPELPQFPIKNTQRIGWDISYRNESLLERYLPRVNLKPIPENLSTLVGITTGADARIMIPGSLKILTDLPLIFEGKVYLDANSTYYDSQDITVIDMISREYLKIEVGIGAVYALFLTWEKSLSRIDFDSFELQLMFGNVALPSGLPKRWNSVQVLELTIYKDSQIIPDFENCYPKYERMVDTHVIMNGTIQLETQYLWLLKRLDHFLFVFDDLSKTHEIEELTKIQAKCDWLRELGIKLLLLPIAPFVIGFIRPKLVDKLDEILKKDKKLR